MTETAPLPKKRSSRLSKLVLVALLLVVAGIAIAMWSRAQAKHLGDEFKAHGYPTSLQELDAWYVAVPKHQNAALKFLAARDAMVMPADAAQLPYVGSGEQGIEALTPELLPIAEAYLAANGSALELAHAAAGLRFARYPVDLSEWPMPISRLEDGQKVARLLWLEAAVRARQGNGEAATSALEAAFAYTRSVAGDPFMMSHLQSLSLLTGTISESSGVLSAVALDAKQLDRLGNAARDVHVRQSFERALVSEVVFALYSDHPGNAFDGPAALVDRVAYSRLMLALIESTTLLPPEMTQELRRLNVAQFPLARFTQPATDIVRAAYLDRESTAKGLAMADLFKLIVTVEKFRLARKALPAKLEELAPRFIQRVPEDPFGEGSYQFEIREGAYSIYSVGPDGVDGRGDPAGGESDELVLQVTH